MLPSAEQEIVDRLIRRLLCEDEDESDRSLRKDGNDSDVQSLQDDGNESVHSIHEDGNKSVQSLQDDGNESVQSIHEDGDEFESVQSIRDGNESDSVQSIHEDANESELSDDVINIFDEKDEDLIKKLDGHRWICDRCYPSANFHKRNLFIIHRTRHFSENHFICPICRKGFVKLKYCINHELTEHKNETQLNNQGLASAVPLILPRSGNSNPIINTQNYSKTENNVIYSDYAVASTSLYPYHGPPVEDCYDTYDIQYKYGRPDKSMANSAAKTANLCRTDFETYPRQEIKQVAAADEPLSFSQSRGLTNGCETPVISDDYISDYSSQGSWKTKKRKIYRKKAKRVKKPEVKAYCCNICPFTSNLEAEFKEHSQTLHPNFTADQVLQFFVLPSLGSYSPVRKKKTNIDPPPRKRIRYDFSDDDDSTGESILPSSSLTSSSPPESVISSVPDWTTKEGFFSSLGLISNQPS